MTPLVQRCLVLALAVLAVPFLPVGDHDVARPAEAASFTISEVRATPTQDGSTILFTWETNVPTTSVVHYGLTSGDLDQSSAKLLPVKALGDTPTPVFETKHSVLVSATRTFTYFYSVGGSADATSAGQFSPEDSVLAVNGPTSWDGSKYTVNVYTKFDYNANTASMTNWGLAAEMLALLVHDMTDGFVHVGRVILEDSSQFEMNGFLLCGGLLNCLSGADTVILTTAPYDSHTFAGGISSGDPIVLGRFGQLVVPWGGPDHRAFVWAHEYGHYGFWLDDQYSESGNTPCVNSAWDVSIMHNSNVFTEMDHSGTPCSWQNSHGGQNSWDHYFRPHYPNVPHRATPDEGFCDFGVCSGSPPAGFELVKIDRDTF